MKRACANCIYFATIQIYRCKPFNWCALGMLRIKGNGYKFCPTQTPLPPPQKKTNKMTPQQQMVFAIILFVLCIGLVVYSNLILRGARKIAKEAYAGRDRAEEEKACANELYECAKKEWKKRTNEVAELYNRLCLPADEYIIVSTEIFVDVCAFHKLPGEDREIIVHLKRFWYGDDRDFALLEAQELLDHLNEK